MGMGPQEAAEASGVTIETLRYYERVGLLDRVPRATNGHRRYRAEDIEWIEVLRCLRATRMPIRNMARYAELARGGPETEDERERMLREHRTQVVEQLGEIEVALRKIDEKLAWYETEEQGT